MTQNTTDRDDQQEDMRYVNRQTGERCSWLETAHAFQNTWLYPEEYRVLRGVSNEEDAERLLREYQGRINERIKKWKMYQ